MNIVDSVVDVGRLLAFALDVSASPGSSGNSAEYARLIGNYLEDAHFRTLFDGIAEGVGCIVSTADRHVGLVLCTRPDGPWAWPAVSSDLPWNRAFADPHQRASHALVTLALLAFIAPTAADLEDLLAEPDIVLPKINARELEQFIRAFCDDCEAKATDPSSEIENRPLWWHWVQLPVNAPSGKRLARNTTTFIVHDILSFLHAGGWLIDTTPNRPSAEKQYRPRRRLLYHYRDVMIDEVFKALQEQAHNAAQFSTEGETTSPESLNLENVPANQVTRHEIGDSGGEEDS